MFLIIIALGILFLVSLYIGDFPGAVAFAFMIGILGWVVWGERREKKE
jgi:hypothetical protein